MYIVMFSRRIGVEAGRGRDFDMHFSTEVFQKPPPRTCIVKIYQKFTVVNLFIFVFYLQLFVSAATPLGLLHPWFDAINDIINVL